MYRRSSGKSVLQGVLSGAYAGGRREVDVAKLPASTRKRLANALRGRSGPTPILYRRPVFAHARATWMIVVALVALGALTAVGFGDATHAWAREPIGLVAAWALAGVALAASLVAVARRRSRLTGETLPEGRWLLPLDIVDVPPATARHQVIAVTPLGDARDASVAASAVDAPELVITLEGGDVVRFPLRSASEGEVALLQLEHSQRLLEDLTYGVASMDRALQSDAFFDLRIDGSWAAVAPEPRARTRELAVRRQRTTSFAAAGLGLALGAGGFVVRNDLSDHAMFQRALDRSTPAAFDAYLAKGRRHVEAARLAREQAVAREEARLREVERVRESGAGESPRDRMAASCVARLEARSAPDHPEVATLLKALVERAESGEGRRTIPIRVTRKVAAAPPDVDAERLDLPGRERMLGWAFERVFSEICPASIVRFALVEADPHEAPAPGIDLATAVTWGKPSPAADAGSFAPRAIEMVFDLRFRGERDDRSDRLAFRLTVPVEPTMTLRERSLYTLPGDPRATQMDARVITVMASRGFDRLYDELCTWVFAGDPRVPLREDMQLWGIPSATASGR